MVDRPAKDMRRARSALTNLIPNNHCSATAITLIYPELEGRLNGHACARAASQRLAHTIACSKSTVQPPWQRSTHSSITACRWPNSTAFLAMKSARSYPSDYLNDPRSSIIDAQSTLVVNGTQVKL